MAAMAMAPRQQTLSLHDMLRDMAAQEHLLLMGNQGVGCSVELMTYDWVDLEDSCSHTLGVLQIIILSGFYFCHFRCHFVCHCFFRCHVFVVVFWFFWYVFRSIW